MTFVTWCSSKFIPSAMYQGHLYLPINKKCYIFGTYSRCLSEWEKHVGDMTNFFHEVKIIHTIWGKGNAIS